VLKNLADQDKPDAVKVFNLVIAIRRLVEEEAARMPYLVSIEERAEAVAEAFELRPQLPQANAALAARVPGLEVPSEGIHVAGTHPVVPGGESGSAPTSRSWWQEMLKSMLPTVGGPLITAAGSGFDTILAAANGASVLAAVRFVIAVIAAVVGAYFGSKLQVEPRNVQQAGQDTRQILREAATRERVRQATQEVSAESGMGEPDRSAEESRE
jgi:hypothetical protein